MKYNIPQSRLNELIFKYLDMQDFNMVEKDNYIYFIENVGDKYGFLKYNYDTGSLFILKVFADKISNIFGIPIKDLERIISSWVEKTFGVKVVWVYIGTNKFRFF